MGGGCVWRCDVKHGLMSKEKLLIAIHTMVGRFSTTREMAVHGREGETPPFFFSFSGYGA